MSKPIFTPFPILNTERLTLRQLGLSDGGEIFIMHSDMENRKYIDKKPPRTLEDSIAFIININVGIKNNEWVYWAIFLKEENKLIGTICLWNFSKDYKRAEIGYELNPNYQGKGYMGEALKRVISFGFKTLKINEIEAFSHVGNMGSIKLLKKNDFLKTKIIKEKFQGKKGFFEMAVYMLGNTGLI